MDTTTTDPRLDARVLLPGREGARPPLRRGLLHRGPHDRHLLPSLVPGAHPRAANVTFHLTAAAAQGAGFRACKRCRPDATPGSPEWDVAADVVGRAMRLIADGVVDREGVAGLAARLGYSARQLNRLLTAELGAGPLALARAQRAQTARVLIETTDLPFAEIAFASGFASIRQFNDTVREVFADHAVATCAGDGARPRPGRGRADHHPPAVRRPPPRCSASSPSKSCRASRRTAPAVPPRTLACPTATAPSDSTSPRRVHARARPRRRGDLALTTCATRRRGAARPPALDADCGPVRRGRPRRRPGAGPLVARPPGVRVPGHRRRRPRWPSRRCIGQQVSRRRSPHRGRRGSSRRTGSR